MARADPKRVLVPRIASIAAAVAQARRVSEGEALAEISEMLRSVGIRPGSVDGVEALTLAAVTYAVDKPARDQWWFPAAFDFLVGLGANADEARAVRSAATG
jgi:hypothetical protein